MNTPDATYPCGCSADVPLPRCPRHGAARERPPGKRPHEKRQMPSPIVEVPADVERTRDGFVRGRGMTGAKRTLLVLEDHDG